MTLPKEKVALDVWSDRSLNCCVFVGSGSVGALVIGVVMLVVSVQVWSPCICILDCAIS